MNIDARYEQKLRSAATELNMGLMKWSKLLQPETILQQEHVSESFVHFNNAARDAREVYDNTSCDLLKRLLAVDILIVADQAQMKSVPPEERIAYLAMFLERWPSSIPSTTTAKYLSFGFVVYWPLLTLTY